MDPIISIIAPIVLIIIGYTVGSAKIVNSGNQALVERLGRYNRKIGAGLNFIIPFVEAVVLEDTTRERLLDIPPQQAITKDSVSLKVDALLYWQVWELEKAYYEVEDIETSLEKLVLTMLRSAIGEMDLKEIYSSRKKINQILLQQLDHATAPWGVKVIRVEVEEFKLEKHIHEALELEWAAETKKKASILEAEATVQSVKLLSDALKSNTLSKEVLNFLVAQRYVDASQQLSASPNSKVIFMDPKALTESLNGLMADMSNPPNLNNSGNP